jgi:hypothetical protein
MAEGGSGFAPPYLFPNPTKSTQLIPLFSSPPPQTTTTPASTIITTPTNPPDNTIAITLREGAKPTPASAPTATRFVQNLGNARRHEPPAAVFCSRELERELAAFVAGEVATHGKGGFPSDERIRQRARVFLGVGEGVRTAVDDAVLLGRFGEMMRGRLGLVPLGGAGGVQQQQMGGLDEGFEMDFSGVMASEMDDVLLQDLDFDFGDMGDFMGVATGGMPMDQF